MVNFEVMSRAACCSPQARIAMVSWTVTPPGATLAPVPVRCTLEGLIKALLLGDEVGEDLAHGNPSLLDPGSDLRGLFR